MISFENFKKALGPIADSLSDMEIEQRRIYMDKFADAFFDHWIKKRASYKIKIDNKEFAPQESL